MLWLWLSLLSLRILWTSVFSKKSVSWEFCLSFFWNESVFSWAICVRDWIWLVKLAFRFPMSLRELSGCPALLRLNEMTFICLSSYIWSFYLENWSNVGGKSCFFILQYEGGLFFRVYFFPSCNKWHYFTKR